MKHDPESITFFDPYTNQPIRFRDLDPNTQTLVRIILVEDMQPRGENGERYVRCDDHFHIRGG